MDMDKCIGAMAVFTKVNGRAEYKMGKDKSMYLVKDSKRGFLRIMFL
jgi:hypothetical protein